MWNVIKVGTQKEKPGPDSQGRIFWAVKSYQRWQHMRLKIKLLVAIFFTKFLKVFSLLQQNIPKMKIESLCKILSHD